MNEHMHGGVVFCLSVNITCVILPNKCLGVKIGAIIFEWIEVSKHKQTLLLAKVKRIEPIISLRLKYAGLIRMLYTLDIYLGA